MFSESNTQKLEFEFKLNNIKPLNLSLSLNPPMSSSFGLVQTKMANEFESIQLKSNPPSPKKIFINVRSVRMGKCIGVYLIKSPYV